MRSTHSADRVLGRLFHHDLLPELARRAVAERLVRMHRVVVLEPTVELAQYTGGIGARADLRVVALESLHKSFGHAIGLWAFDWRRARHQADLAGQLAGLAGGVWRAVVGQPLDRQRQLVHQPEALFDALDDQIADVAAVDAAGRRHPR